MIISLWLRVFILTLSSSEDKLEFDFSQKQITLFKESFTKIINSINNKPVVHLCNTSGVFNFPNAHFDMVRCGIGLYGFSNKLVRESCACGQLKIYNFTN